MLHIENKEELSALLKQLDIAIKLLKKDATYWHTPAELDEIYRTIDEIKKFRAQIIRENM